MALENKFPRALENQDGNCVWDASRRTLLFPAIVCPLHSPASRTTRRNKYRGGASKLEMKKVRLTATRVSVSHYNRFKLQSRLLLREVILWSSLTMPAYWKRDAPPGSPRRGYPRDISLFEKRMRYLFIREKRPRRLFIRETYATSLYIFDTKRIRDFSEMKRTVQRIDCLL